MNKVNQRTKMTRFQDLQRENRGTINYVEWHGYNSDQRYVRPRKPDSEEYLLNEDS